MIVVLASRYACCACRVSFVVVLVLTGFESVKSYGTLVASLVPGLLTMTNSGTVDMRALPHA